MGANEGKRVAREESDARGCGRERNGGLGGIRGRAAEFHAAR